MIFDALLDSGASAAEVRLRVEGVLIMFGVGHRLLTDTLRHGGLIGLSVRMLAVLRKQHTTKAF